MTEGSAHPATVKACEKLRSLVCDGLTVAKVSMLVRVRIRSLSASPQKERPRIGEGGVGELSRETEGV